MVMLSLTNVMFVQENIKLLTNDKLVKFVEKIGHHEAAKIIKERNVDGNTLLVLDDSDICHWNLSNHQIDQLWNCIHMIKSNPLTYIDVNQRVHLEKLLYAKQSCTETSQLENHCVIGKNVEPTNDIPLERNCHVNVDYETNNRKPLPVPRKTKTYFKFFQHKNVNKNYEHECIERCNSNTFFIPPKDWDSESNASSYSYHTCSSVNDTFRSESDYIYAPGLQGEKDNVVTDRLKKHWKFRNSSKGHKQKYVKSRNSYLELSELTNEPTCSHVKERNIYEHPPSTGGQDSKKKKQKFQCSLNLCCCSCFIGYP